MESKIFISFSKKRLYEMFTYRVKKIANELSRAKYMDLPLNPYLDFYNAYQEAERDGVDYMFDLENKDDVAVLLANCENMKDFRELINSGQRFCFSGVNYPSPRFVNADDIFEYIRYYAFDLAAWMLCFPQCCPKFITHKYLKPHNDLYNHIFPKCDMWDWWYQENNLGDVISDNGDTITIEL